MPLKIQIKIKNYGLKPVEEDEELRQGHSSLQLVGALGHARLPGAAIHEKFIIAAITE